MTALFETSSATDALSGITLEKIRTKQITVGVIGLGYVGFPISLTFSESGIKVIGFDIDQEKIASLAQNRSYIQTVDENRLKNVQGKGLFSATSDFSQISLCEVVIICVPTPLAKHLEPDLTYIAKTCACIAPRLKAGTLVSLESTTWPGTTREVVKTYLEKGCSLKAGKDLYLCFSPEREDPGNKEYQTQNVPKLIGGIDETSKSLGAELYSQIWEEVIPVSSLEVAEAAKLFENIFRSVNIALVNEMKIILDKMGIDVWEVIHAAATKPFGFMPFWPGPGLGGHCIPIDPFYLSWKAKEHGVSTRFIELAGEINRSMPGYVVEKVQDCLNDRSKAMRGSKILILGLSYKEDVDDMRESPSLELIRLMEQKGAFVDYHDPYFPEIPPSRSYKDLQGRKSSQLSSEYDCFVIATKHSRFSANKILSYDVPVVDTRNFLPRTTNVYQA